MRIDLALRHEPLHAVREVVLHRAAPLLVAGHLERQPVARRAAEVDPQHRVAGGGEDLVFEAGVEVVAVVGLRPAVEVDDERIALPRGRVEGRVEPGFDLVAVLVAGRELLGLDEIEGGFQVVVEVADPLDRPAVGDTGGEELGEVGGARADQEETVALR